MTKIVKSTKKTKETAIAKTDNPLSLESLRKEGIDTKLSTKDLIDLIVSSKYDELLATAQALKEESIIILTELKTLIEDDLTYPHIDHCIKTELKRIGINSTKVVIKNRRVAARVGILTTRYKQINFATYSRKFDVSLSTQNWQAADVYSCYGSVIIDASSMIPLSCGNIAVPEFILTKETMAKREYLLQRLRDVSDRSEAFYNSLPKSGVVDKVEMAAEIKNLVTKEALKESPDLKLALSERFGVKF